MKNYLKKLILPEEDDDNKNYRKYTYEELKEDNISNAINLTFAQ